MFQSVGLHANEDCVNKALDINLDTCGILRAGHILENVSDLCIVKAEVFVLGILEVALQLFKGLLGPALRV